MTRVVQTGGMKDGDVQLALYRYYVNAHDNELSEFGITRDDVLALARDLEGDSGYRRTELETIADQVIRAYIAGRRKTNS
jgi:hypothetical protein